jgi:N-hydroxyarylamine O-acetyltransferase
MLQLKLPDGSWQDLYSFDLTPVVPMDITYGNHFTSTHPASFFTTARIAVRWSPDGQQRLFNFNATTTTASGEQSEELADDESYLSELAIRLGIELNADYADLKPIG